MPTDAAKEEFDNLFADDKTGRAHPEDREDRSTNSTPHSRDHSLEDFGSAKNLRSGKLNAADSDDDEEGQAGSSSKMRTKYFLPRGRRSDANTGPKGVIADAYAFENAKKAASKRMSFLPNRFSRAVSDFQPTAPPSQYRRDAEKSDASEEDEDDEFMQRWRQSRLQELQQEASAPKERRVSPSGGSRRWGTLQRVDGEGYLDAVEKSPRGTAVVVLIFDDTSEVSDVVEVALKQLAKAHASTRFVRLHYEDAEMEQMGVPAILAYRNGEKFAGLVPVIDEVPDELELNADSLEMVMKKHQILS